MYKRFFGLKENPFNVNPDPRYLFLTKQTEETLSGLMYGIQTRKGIMTLVGEVGTGKTTLVNRLLDWLHQHGTKTAFLFNSRINSTQFFDFTLAEFEIRCESSSKSQQLMKLNEWLVERFRGGETAVLIIDEAQNLTFPVLEEIRLLTNLETSTEKLLQIVLSGQPEFEEKLNLPQLRQLRQRIMIRCKTGALTKEEIHDYIFERLKIAGAGANGQPIFSPAAMEAVHKYSLGIPRVVNLLCEDRKSTRLNSSHEWISYAVFCLKKKIRQAKKKEDKRRAYLALLQERLHQLSYEHFLLHGDDVLSFARPVIMPDAVSIMRQGRLG